MLRVLLLYVLPKMLGFAAALLKLCPTTTTTQQPTFLVEFRGGINGAAVALIGLVVYLSFSSPTAVLAGALLILRIYFLTRTSHQKALA